MTEARPRLAAAVLLGVYVALVLALGGAVDRTADETTYLGAGRVIAVEGWTHPSTVLHGPLPFYANQLFVDPAAFPREFDDIHAGEHPELYRRGRLGMLPFGILTALLVALWARRLWGAWGGVCALALFVAHPLMAAYGALIAVDMAYCAGVVASLFAAWAYVRRPGLARAAVVGLTVGLSLATKYLALLTVPVPLLAVPIVAARRGLKVAVLATGVTAGAALLALWASYGFAVEPASAEPESYTSRIAAAVQLPGAGLAIGCLPEPWVRGIDFQLSVGDRTYNTYLRGRSAPGHFDYYLWVFLLKTPEWILTLVAIGLILGGASLRRGPPRDEVKAALALVVPACGLLFVYLSAFTSLQIGVRYVLPVFPLGAVLLGGLGPVLGGSRAPRAAAVVGALALLLTVVDAGRQWPNWLAYTNALSGGPEESWRTFSDSNTEWGQTRRRGRAALEARDDVAILAPGAGPRLGRWAVYLRDLTAADPEDRTRARHWIDFAEPVEVVGTAWYVFDADAAAWEAHVERTGDERRRQELAIALWGAGRVADARRVAAALPASRLEAWEAWGRRVDVADSDPQRRLEAARAWLKVGRGDRALDVLEGLGQEPLFANYLRARALALEGRDTEALAALDQERDDGPATTAFRVQLLRRLGRPEEAYEWLGLRPETWDELGEPGDAVRAALQREIRDRETLRRVLEATR